METSNNNEKKKTVLPETDHVIENETSGETSSISGFSRSTLSHTPTRKNKPLGASHEPGVMPGSEL
ncbi:hypothetical protein ACVWYN_001787 [Pedobacter sp. UYP24]